MLRGNPFSHLPQAGVILQPNWLPVRGALLGRSVTRHALAGRVTREFESPSPHRTIYEFWTTRPHAPSPDAEMPSRLRTWPELKWSGKCAMEGMSPGLQCVSVHAACPEMPVDPESRAENKPAMFQAKSNLKRRSGRPLDRHPETPFHVRCGTLPCRDSRFETRFENAT